MTSPHHVKSRGFDLARPSFFRQLDVLPSIMDGEVNYTGVPPPPPPSEGVVPYGGGYPEANNTDAQAPSYLVAEGTQTM